MDLFGILIIIGALGASLVMIRFIVVVFGGGRGSFSCGGRLVAEQNAKYLGNEKRFSFCLDRPGCGTEYSAAKDC